MGQGLRAVFDTNILIDYLGGIDAAKEELASYDAPAVSVVTWMEVLCGARSPVEENLLRRFLNRFEIIELTRSIATRAVAVRQALRLRLPDAIILATANELSCLLVTRNTRDFSADSVGIRVPYTL